MFKKDIDTRQQIHDLLSRRWSGRAYDPERPVAREHIIALLEAARWAPSCFGEQPWYYLVCDKNSGQEAWDKALSCLAEGNQSWADKAPLLILALANKVFSRNGENNRWSQYDTGAATMSICIQATDLGLMVHQMGGFDAQQITESFAIPEQYQPISILAAGYQLPEDRIPADMIERESAPRYRNPLAEQFFDGVWGKSYE